jgi:hypothetical protein
MFYFLTCPASHSSCVGLLQHSIRFYYVGHAVRSPEYLL